MYVRLAFRIAIAVTAALALVAYASHVITIESDPGTEHWSPMFTFMTVLVILVCFAAMLVWLPALAPPVSVRGRAARRPFASPPRPRRLPPPVTNGTVYGSSPVTAWAPVLMPSPQSSAVDTASLPAVRPAAVAVAAPDAEMTDQEGGGAALEGYLAASDPAGGTPPDDGYLRGFATGALDQDRDDNEGGEL